MAEWYKDWFNTKYYHILYQNRNFDEAQDFIKELLTHLEIKTASKVLDLACGKGRHSIYLNQLGFDVLGVDLSPENIEHANQFQNDTLNFKIHDMRDPLPGYEFDAVLNLFTSFAYFQNDEDNVKVIQSIASYLKKDGFLIIDFFNTDMIVANMQHHGTTEKEGIQFKFQKTYDGKFIRKNIHVKDGEQEMEFEEVVQALKLSDFRILLEEQGFEIVEIFGDYNLSTFDPVKSDRLIIKAQLK